MNANSAIEDVVLILYQSLGREPEERRQHIIDLIDMIRYGLKDNRSTYSYVNEVIVKNRQAKIIR